VVSGASEAWTRQYLDFLGFDTAADAPLPPPDIETLRRLTRAHLLRVPFESVTSVLRRQAATAEKVPPLDADAILSAWAARRAGALCFEVTEMLSRLFVALGYAAHPLLGQISFPGSHQAVSVVADDRRYLVDLGNGAPLFEPIPLDETVEVRSAGLAYRFHPADGFCIQDRWIDDAWQPFCRYGLGVPSNAERYEAYQQHHVRGCSFVVDSVVLVRCAEDAVWSLRDGVLNHFTHDGKRTIQVGDGETEYQRLAHEVFGLSQLPIGEALRALR
jgi:arylamine N-acetyltransferase